MHDPVFDRRDAQRTLPPIWLWDVLPPNRTGAELPLFQLLLDLIQERIDAATFDHGESFAIYPGRAAVQLVEAGTLELDAPIGDVLEGLSWEGGQVTLHHLLSHTSGLIGWSAALPAADRARATTQSLLAVVKEQGLQSNPGECFEYSDANALLLGAAIEAVSEKSLSELITERILGPAGVESSGFDIEDAPPKEAYAGGSREISGVLVTSPEGVHAFGEDNFCASAMDLFRIRGALVDQRLLGEAQLNAMLEPARLVDGTDTGFGYGVNLPSLTDMRGLSVGGSAEGTTVHMAYYPEPEVTVVVLVAAESAPIVALGRDLTRIVLGLPLPGVQNLELTADETKRFVGRYQIGCTTYVVARPEVSGQLTIATAERPTDVLLYQGDGRFVTERDPDVRVEFLVEKGDDVAARMTLVDHGRRSDAVRI